MDYAFRIGCFHFSLKCVPFSLKKTRGGVLHYGARRGCVPVLGSFWPENSGIGIYLYWKISVIGVYFHLSLGIFWDWGLLLYSKFWLWVLNESTTG